MMRADGNMTKAELTPIKDFLRRSYSESDAKNLLQLLKYRLGQSFMDIRPYCMILNRTVSYREKLIILNLLFQIAYATESLSEEEIIVIKQFSKYTSITNKDFEIISQMYAGQGNGWRNDYRGNGKQRANWNNPSSSKEPTKLDEAYKTLGITSDATEDQVKSAYRALAKKYHPDLYANKSEKEKEKATKKFREINEAYKYICDAKGIK